MSRTAARLADRRQSWVRVEAEILGPAVKARRGTRVRAPDLRALRPPSTHDTGPNPHAQVHRKLVCGSEQRLHGVQGSRRRPECVLHPPPPLRTPLPLAKGKSRREVEPRFPSCLAVHCVLTIHVSAGIKAACWCASLISEGSSLDFGCILTRGQSFRSLCTTGTGCDPMCQRGKT